MLLRGAVKFPLRAACVVFSRVLWARVSNRSLAKEKIKIEKREEKKKLVCFGKITSPLKDFRGLLSISSYNQIQVSEVQIRVLLVEGFLGGGS